jgi:hypothetical protein
MVHVPIPFPTFTSHYCILLPILLSLLAGNHDSLVLARLQVVEHFLHFVDERGVAGQVLHVFVGDDDSADGFGEVDEQGGVAHVVFGYLGWVASYFLQVLGTARSKNREPNDSVADHDSAILNEHGVVDAHEETTVEHFLHVLVQFVEFAIDVCLFPVTAVVKGNFFRMIKQIRVFRPILALQLLFNCSELAERRRHDFNNACTYEVPAEREARAFPSHQFCQFPAEQYYVKYWFCKIQI